MVAASPGVLAAFLLLAGVCLIGAAVPHRLMSLVLLLGLAAAKGVHGRVSEEVVRSSAEGAAASAPTEEPPGLAIPGRRLSEGCVDADNGAVDQYGYGCSYFSFHASLRPTNAQ